MFERIVFVDNRAVEATATKRADGKYALTLKVHSAKLVAAGKGREAEEPMDEIVDIGVFSRPPGGEESDAKGLYLEQHPITGPDNTIELVPDEEPIVASIDPYTPPGDRKSSDHRKGVRTGWVVLLLPRADRGHR